MDFVYGIHLSKVWEPMSYMFPSDDFVECTTLESAIATTLEHQELESWYERQKVVQRSLAKNLR